MTRQDQAPRRMAAAKPNTFFGGAAILAMGILVVKVIGLFYKIPLVNIIGSEGSADFNNAYNIYSVLLTISTAGLPVAVSKMVSEANALGRQNQVHKVFRLSLAAFLTLGVVSFLIMYFGSEQLAGMMHDSLAAAGIRALAPAVICVGCLSAFRGYAQGHSDMVPTAVSQVLEALTKLIVGLFLAWYLLYLGFGSEISAAGAIGGVTASGLVALLYLMVRPHRRNSPRSLPPATDKPEGSGKILKTLVVIAIPITLSSSVVPITTYLDTIQVQNLLQSALGYAEELAVSLYGCYQKAVTIYNLPSAFMVSLTACIVPAVSAALTKKDKVGAGKIAESALRVGAMLALPAGIGLTVLAGPIIQLLYPETNQEVGTQCLMVLGIASIFVCIMLLCNAILQANGRTALPIWFIAIGSAIKLGVNFVLVQMPSVGIKGAPVGTLVCFGIVSVLELAAIKRVTPHPPKYLRVFGKAAVAAVLMGAAAWASYGLLSGHFGNTLSVAGAILVGCVVYVILVVALRVVSKDDLSLMPKGEKIAKLLRIR